MTVKRKLLFITAAVVLLLTAALALLWTNLDWIVKNAMEKYGSQAIGTSVRVKDVSLQPAKGKGAITGLTVANPRGYSAPHIISLGRISVRLSPRTVTANPVVIDDIRITSPLVVYETNDDRVANVDVLKKNLGANSSTPPPGKGRKSGETRIRIRQLVIENAKAEVRIASLGDKPRTVSLPRIAMTNVGGPAGAPPETVAKEIATFILAEVSKEVGKAGAERLLEKAVERALKRR
jgi:hypothetical protein